MVMHMMMHSQNEEWQNVYEDITDGGYEWYHVHHIPDVPPSGVRSRQGSMPGLEPGTVATVSGIEDDEKSMARVPASSSLRCHGLALLQ